MPTRTLNPILCTIVALSGLALATPTSAQANDGRAKAMMVLDASGSMWGQIDGTAKISIARDVIDGVLQDWDPDIDLGLIAYGHRRKGDCSDIETVQPIAPLDPAQFSATVRSINPVGKTPISESLFRAARELRHIEDPSTVILVSDGLETC